MTPFETVTIRTQIAGVLQHVGFTEGQTVKAGDFIAQIDPRPYEAALAQAQGQLAKDQALLTQAQGDLARYQQLAKQDSDRPAAGHRSDGACRAGQGGDLRRPGAARPRELNVGYTHIVSPITGRVGLRLARPRQLFATLGRQRHCRHHRDRSDERGVHHTRGQFAAHRSAAQFRGQASGHGARPKQREHADDGDADHLRQPDRRDHRHHQDAGDVRQPQGRPVPRTSSSTSAFWSIR